jgi:hypothetical protein
MEHFNIEDIEHEFPDLSQEEYALIQEQLCDGLLNELTYPVEYDLAKDDYYDYMIILGIGSVVCVTCAIINYFPF